MRPDPVDLPEPAGVTVPVGVYPAAVKLARMVCQDAVVGHASSTEALKQY
jgi:hypothetical protein